MTGRVVALALVATLVSACAATPSARIGMAADQPVVEMGQAGYTSADPASYRLRPADVVTVNVFREPDLSIEDMPISTEGMLSLPLLGAIKAEGLTTAELADTVTQRLANGVLQHPAVSVNVKQYGSHVVTVEGAVEKPGVYSYGPGARLSTAIALASGLNRVAKSSQVAVFRKTPQGIAIAKFNYGAVASGTMLDPVLEPGDRVVVGTSGLSQFWQDLLKALPAFALFTNLNI